MRPEERGGPGNAGRGSVHVPRGGVTPQRGEGALGTVRARRVTPDETWCSIAMVNGADGERGSKPCGCGVYVRVHLSFQAYGKAVSR